MTENNEPTTVTLRPAPGVVLRGSKIRSTYDDGRVEISTPAGVEIEQPDAVPVETVEPEVRPSASVEVDVADLRCLHKRALRATAMDDHEDAVAVEIGSRLDRLPRIVLTPAQAKAIRTVAVTLAELAKIDEPRPGGAIAVALAAVADLDNEEPTS
jgi:hypothetical protein